MTGTDRLPRATRRRSSTPTEGVATAAIALTVLAPLAVLPSASNPYTFPKLLVTVLAISVCAVAQRHGQLPRPVLAVAGVGAVVFVLASIQAVGSPIPSLVGRWPRYEGLPVLGVYLLCAWAGARLLGGHHHERIRSMQWWIALSSLILGGFSCLDAVGLSPLGWTSAERTGSLLGNATDQGLVAMMFAALLIAPSLRKRSPLLVAGLASAVLTIGLSGSRAAILALGLVVAIHLLLLGRDRARPLGLVLAGMAALALALPQARDRLFLGQTMESRLLAWKETLRLAGDHLLLGVGPSGYSDAIGRYQDPEWVKVVGAEAKPDSPHSWPLQALAAGGVPLLLVAVAIAVLVMTLGWRAVRRSPAVGSAEQGATGTRGAHHRSELLVGLFAAVAAYGAALLLNFTTPTTTGLAAFLTGALIAERPRSSERSSIRALASLAGAAGVVVLVVTCLTDVALRNGAELAAAGKVGLAVERFETVERLRPWDADARMLSAQYLAEQASRGDRNAARQAEERARDSLRATPDSYESKVALGVALITRKQLRPALVELDEAVELYPYRGQAYVQRAIARTRLGDVPGGVKDLQIAIALRPDDPIPKRLLLDLQLRIQAAQQRR